MRVSVVLVRGLVAEVERRGLDWRALLKQSEIEGSRMVDLRQMLELREIERLLDNALALTGDPGLGIAIGEHAPVSMLQVLGHLLQSQPTLRSAFEVLTRYSSLLIEGVTFQLDEAGALASFSCSKIDGNDDVTRCLMDVSLSIALRIGWHYLADDARPSELQLGHAAPPYAASYGKLFGCPVSFERPHYALVFDRAYLDVPQHHADETVRVASETLLERLLGERNAALSTADRVLQVLNNERDWDAVNSGRIADRLGLSVRALRRRLGAEGAPISTLLDQTRCRIACEQLSREDASVKATAELLGFSEPSAFHRAFRRWTGRTPGQYVKFERYRPAEEIRVPPATKAQRLLS